jgi:perosamine synthetase
MLMLELGEGDEVIVPPITFVSTVHAVEYVGATPVFADVDPETLCMDPADVARKITDRTRCILPVHYGGQPCDMDAIHALTEGREITVVEDAAHAAGASYKGKKVGSISPLTCFSFHAVKNLAMGEGGALACAEAWQDKWLREMRWLGISKDTFTRTNDVYAWQYFVGRLGWKAHLSDVAACLGREQLKKLDANNARRRAIWQRYGEAFAGLDFITPLTVRPDCESSHHLCVVKLPDLDSRDRMIGHLKERKISPGVHYYPIHMHPYYQDRQASCPVSERVWQQIISLPVYPDLTEQEQSRVIEAVRSFGG